MAWITPSGSMIKRPRMSTPRGFVVDAVHVADLAARVGQHGEGTPPSTILESSSPARSCGRSGCRCSSTGSAHPVSSNSDTLAATAANSVGQTKVKSPG